MKQYYAIMFAALLVLSAGVGAVSAKRNQPTLLETALAANGPGGAYEGQFDTLIAAVLAADPQVVYRLDGLAQYTVFAPTDDAFEAAFNELGVSAADVLANQAFLTDVLEYHLVRGRRTSEDVLDSTRIRTIERSVVYQDGGVLTDELGRTANIVVTDVPAKNGIIHAIDNVILPYAP